MTVSDLPDVDTRAPWFSRLWSSSIQYVSLGRLCPMDRRSSRAYSRHIRRGEDKIVDNRLNALCQRISSQAPQNWTSLALFDNHRVPLQSETNSTQCRYPSWSPLCHSNTVIEASWGTLSHTHRGTRQDRTNDTGWVRAWTNHPGQHGGLSHGNYQPS
jgi:hypothetical protein